jgi:hypothetical protein
MDYNGVKSIKNNAVLGEKESSRIFQVIFVGFSCILGETGLREASFELAEPSRVVGLEYFFIKH